MKEGTIRNNDVVSLRSAEDSRPYSFTPYFSLFTSHVSRFTLDILLFTLDVLLFTFDDLKGVDSDDYYFNNMLS